MPPTSRGTLRRREQFLIAMLIGTFIFILIEAFFLLPNNQYQSSSANKAVYKVYKQFQYAGHQLVAPPIYEEAVKGGIIDRPFEIPNGLLHDKVRLFARIEEDRKGVLERIIPATQQKIPSDKKSDLSSTHTKKNVDIISMERRNFIRGMMLHAWKGYSMYAWGHNEVRPISLKRHTSTIFGSTSMGATIVDGMDTLYVMELYDEFEEGKKWIKESLNFSKMSGDISVFETNIRYVGGLLSLYAMTGDVLFMKKAIDIVDLLLPAFNTKTGIPKSLINIRTGRSKNFPWANGGSSILSEFGTLQMEFAYLSDISGNEIYRQKVDRIRRVVNKSARKGKLYSNYINPSSGQWGEAHTSIGALGDSFYEYLLKEWIRSGKTDLLSKRMFDEAIHQIVKQLVQTTKSGLTYIAEFKYGRLLHKMDHLACFSGGLFGLAAKEEANENSDRWMEIAAGITNTCHESYNRTETKLGPEAFWFTETKEAQSKSLKESYYILRPETVESYFVMWRLTHEQKYRDWGWEFVQALEKYCRSIGGYTGIKNVNSINSAKDDVQQSFFIAETLKYLYLLFSDDSVISLDDWVFNTEAHPLPIKRKNNEFYRQFNSQNM